MPAARVSQLISSIAPSATLAVDAKAKALRAQGRDVIGFGAGEPDFPTPDHIVEAAARACRDVANHKYSPPAGQPALREAIALKTARDSGYEVDASQVVVTNGGKHAVAAAMLTLLDPDDEVLVPAPYWTTYPEAIRLARAVPKVIQTHETTGFRATVEQLEAAFTPKTKALLFVSPSNPTGAVYPPEEVAAVGRWAAEKGIWVITDEIYEHLVYGDTEHVSIVTAVPELADRCIVLNGVAKSYAMTGWRVGWLIGPGDIAKAAGNLQSHTTSNVCNVAQAASLAALEGDMSALEEMRTAFDRRRLIIHRMLNEIPGVSCIEPEGAFYAYASFASVLGRRIDGQTPETSLALADLALEKASVAFVPAEAFGSSGYGRFSFAMADDDMIEGIRRLGELISRAD